MEPHRFGFGEHFWMCVVQLLKVGHSSVQLAHGLTDSMV